jgi:hypothetical protein
MNVSLPLAVRSGRHVAVWLSDEREFRLRPATRGLVPRSRSGAGDITRRWWWGEPQNSGAVGNHNDHCSALGESALKRIDHATCGQSDQKNRQGKREPHVLADDLSSHVGEANELRQASEIGAKQGDVGTAEGHFVQLGADCDADIGSAERRRIVHAISDHHHHSTCGLFGPNEIELLCGKHFSDDFVDAERRTDVARRCRPIAREQNEAIDAKASHRLERFASLPSRLISQFKSPQVAPCAADPDLRRLFYGTVANLHADIFQQRSAAQHGRLSVDRSDDAQTRSLLQVRGGQGFNAPCQRLGHDRP